MIWRKYSTSIKTRLLVNVILIHAVLMGFVVYDMLIRERDFMQQQLSAKGHDLSSVLATNASQFLLNNDIVAMNELISGANQVHDLYMVFIYNGNGVVRASKPAKYFNLRLNDPASRKLFDRMQQSDKAGVQVEHDGLIDTMYRVQVGGENIGYVRTILDTRWITREINVITQKGLLFIVAAILFGALFAWLSVRSMTRRLNQLSGVARRLADHDFNVKLPEVTEHDEVGTMTEALTVMKESIHDYILTIDASEQRLQHALEGSSDGLWDWDLVTNAVYFSPRWKEMLGYKEHELPNTFETWQINVHPHDIDIVLVFLNRFLSSGEIMYEQKFRMRRKDGSFVPILARGKKIFDAEGRPIRLVGTHVDLTEITKVQEELRFQAEHDALTQLPNRVLFIDRLQQSIKNARRRHNKLAVVFLDLDHFKEINDSMGHDVGDALLMRIAEVLQKHIRESDTIARFGGDEFALIVDNITQTDAVIDVVNKIMDAIKEPCNIDGHEFFNSFSIGIAIYPEDGDDAAKLLKNADAAMYKAKKSGRDNYQFYTREMTKKALERIQLESRLRYAIENDGFDVNYQPKVDSDSNTVVGMEALVRWSDPEIGMISPAVFIPLAEETGMITSIDILVMKQVFAQMKDWKERGVPLVHVSLNLSMIELTHTNYFDALKQQLDETGVDTSLIELEITESQIMKDPSACIAKLQEINELGIKLSIDDFGTGYSSLSYLKQLPIYCLKIDKSFVDDINYDADDREIITTIISMANNLQLQIVAEGVETREQVFFLSNSGCRVIQGYFYYRPMPSDEMEAVLLKT
jgi:diguanylate cyclase (GGDEF)-like protein/PAS domain S-box-containing protein